MDSIQLIRIEHPYDGWGIWNYNGFQQHRPTISSIGGYEMELLTLKHIAELPAPCSDEIDMNQDDAEWFCAFRSMDEMKAWITPEQIAILKENGFVILVLEVTDYQIGNHQAVYTKESVINQTDITSLY